MHKSNGLRRVKFTQPVLVQKLEDKFDLPDGVPPNTPAVAGQVLVKGDGSGVLEGAEATKFRSGTAICMFMQQWSRLELYNATRCCARMIPGPRPTHVKALEYLIRYVVVTKDRGLVLEPTRKWDGSKQGL